MSVVSGESAVATVAVAPRPPPPSAASNVREWDINCIFARVSRQNGIQLRERFYAIYVCNENTQFLAAAILPSCTVWMQGCWNQGREGMAPHILADQLTLSQPRGGEGYVHHIHTCPTGFSDLPTALDYVSLSSNVWRTSFFLVSA